MLLKEKTSFYKVCFNSMQVGMLVCDGNKRIVLSNSPLSKIFGYSDKEFQILNVDLLFENPELINNYISHSSDDIYNNIECLGIKKNGSKINLELSFGEIIYENKHYYKALITDITDRKEKERIINVKNIELEKEVELRSLALENVIKKLKASLNKEIELNKLKTDFISLASHEFKTPLSAILSSSELLARYAYLNNTDKINQHLGKIKKLVGYLNEMINDILTLENIESAKIVSTNSKIKIDDFLSEIVNNLKLTQLKNQQIVCTLKSCKYIYHDAKILNIIISNVLSNAIKYSKENGKITIDCVVNEEFIIIEVKDEGIGIPYGDQELIFTKFFRSKNASYFPGTGVGLNIVKGYVDFLKGEISFKSKENTGTIFNIQLPKIKSYD